MRRGNASSYMPGQPGLLRGAVLEGGDLAADINERFKAREGFAATARAKANLLVGSQFAPHFTDVEMHGMSATARDELLEKAKNAMVPNTKKAHTGVLRMLEGYVMVVVSIPAVASNFVMAGPSANVFRGGALAPGAVLAECATHVSCAIAPAAPQHPPLRDLGRPPPLLALAGPKPQVAKWARPARTGRRGDGARTEQAIGHKTGRQTCSFDFPGARRWRGQSGGATLTCSWMIPRVGAGGGGVLPPAERFSASGSPRLCGVPAARQARRA